MKRLNPYKGDRVPVTYADDHLIDTSYNSPERLRFTAANMRKLADFMERLPQRKHQQNTFNALDVDHPCGTRACALGWAALAHLIPGLQYDFIDPSHKSMGASPMVNGKKDVDWSVAGRQFFGDDAMTEIFWSTGMDKDDIVSELRELADKAEAEAGGA